MGLVTAGGGTGAISGRLTVAGFSDRLMAGAGCVAVAVGRSLVCGRGVCGPRKMIGWPLRGFSTCAAVLAGREPPLGFDTPPRVLVAEALGAGRAVAERSASGAEGADAARSLAPGRGISRPERCTIPGSSARTVVAGR